MSSAAAGFAPSTAGSAAPGAPAGSVFVKRAGDARARFAEVAIFEGDTVARLAKRASLERGWGVDAAYVDLFLVKPGGEDEPSAAEEEEKRLLSQGVAEEEEEEHEAAEVEVADDFPVRLVEPEGPVEARLEEGSGIDWLDLHLGVLVAGERIAGC